MPNEIFLFAGIATLFIVVATLVTTIFWRWNCPPLPMSLAPAPLSIRVKRLFRS